MDQSVRDALYTRYNSIAHRINEEKEIDIQYFCQAVQLERAIKFASKMFPYEMP